MATNADGRVVFEIDMDTKGFDEEIKNTEAYLNKLLETYEKAANRKDNFDPDEKKLANLRVEIEKTRNKYVDLKKKQLGLEQSTDDINENVINFKDTFKKITESSGKILKRVLRWSVALFGIRSAYTAIRQAMATISQYDKTMKSNVDYIRYAVAMTLKPVVEWIINQVYKLLQYINYIAQKWFGKNLFENAGAKAFKEANKNAKEYQKTLAGFDEMDILKKVDSVDELNPTYDLSKQLSQAEIPTWLKWIGDHRDVFQIVAEGFGILFGAKAIATILNATGAIIGSKTVGLVAGTGLLGVYAALLLIAGVTFYNLKKNLDELQEKTDEISKGLDNVEKNEHTYRINLKANDEEFWDKFSKGELNSTITSAYASNLVNDMMIDINSAIEANTQANKIRNTLWNKLFGGNEETIGEFENTVTTKFDTAFRIFDKLKKQYDAGFMTDTDYANAVRNLQKLIDTIGRETLTEVYKLDKETIDNVVKALNSEINKANLSKLNKLKVEIEANPDKLTEMLENIKNIPLIGKTLYNQITNIISKLNATKTKKNAMGGIINLPGRGVNLGYSGGYQQNGGEAGYEGLIPMDNASQMELIGRAVAKYTTINLTNITKLDNREIAREQKRISAEDDFAYNR